MSFLSAMVRRTNLLPLVAVLTAAYGFILTSRNEIWLGEGRWALDWLGIAPAIVGPLLLGYAYVITASAAKNGETESFAATRRGVIGYISTTSASVAIAGATAQLLALAVVGTLLISRGLAVPADGVVALLPSFIALLAYAAVGARLGTTVRKPVLAPVLALVSFGVFDIVGTSRGSSLVSFGGATASLIGLMHRSDIIILQSVFCLAVVVAAITGFRRLAGGIALAAVAGSAIAVVSLGSSRFEFSPINLICSTAKPVICLAPDHAADRTAIFPIAERIDTALAEMSQSEPTAWSEAINGDGRLPGDSARILIGDDAGVSTQSFAIAGAHWLESCVFNPSDASQDQRQNENSLAGIVAIGLALEAEPGLQQSIARQAPQWFTAATPSQRMTWLRSVAVPALRACSFDHLPPPINLAQ